MTATPRVSVITPAYNSETTLADAVKSGLAQTVGDLEMIVVDDGSNVPVADVLGEVNDPRIRIIRQPTNRGVAKARNIALNAARAPLAAHLDSDDGWEPDYLEHVLPRFENPRVGLVYTNARVIGNPDLEIYITDPENHPLDTFPELARRNPVVSTTATFRTEAARAVGGYSRWLWASTDYELWLKLAAAGWHFDYVDRVLAYYTFPQRERGMSYDTRRVDRNELALWTSFALRHPRIPLARRELFTRIVRRNLRHVRALQWLRADPQS